MGAKRQQSSRRHAPTEAKEQPMPKLCEAWATTLLVFSGGK